MLFGKNKTGTKLPPSSSQITARCWELMYECYLADLGFEAPERSRAGSHTEGYVGHRPNVAMLQKEGEFTDHLLSIMKNKQYLYGLSL